MPLMLLMGNCTTLQHSKTSVNPKKLMNDFWKKKKILDLPDRKFPHRTREEKNIKCSFGGVFDVDAVLGECTLVYFTMSSAAATK